MKTLILSLFVIAGFSACSPDPTSADSSETPQFAIAPADVSNASIVISPLQGQMTVVRVEFSEAKAEAFRKFTKKHLDRQIQVMVGTQVVAEPIIRAEIPGGVVELRFPSPVEAQTVVTSLTQQ